MNEKCEQTYYGRGNAEMYDDYMDFINYVFGFNGSEQDFKKLLPKLYRPEDDPAANSYVAAENGRLKAAVGAYELDVSVGGELLHTRNIGNVAVHPYARSKGYMRRLMNNAVDDMVRDGIDYSALGGKRQRYNYFSYDPVGVNVSLTFNADNIRHRFGSPRDFAMRVSCVSDDDKETLDLIYELYRTLPFYGIRKRERLLDILSSWSSSVFCAYDGDDFVGYAVVNCDGVNEIVVKNEKRLPELVGALFDTLGREELVVNLPQFMPGYIEELCRIAEEYSIKPEKSFTVLNYERTVRAFMSLKAKTLASPLPDGELTLLIHGKGGDENITLRASNGDADVRATSLAPDLELEHLDAMNLLFAPICPARDRLAPFAGVWLPLPLYLYPADAV